MTQKVNPSIRRPAEAFKTAGAIALAGGSTYGWISPSGEPSDISTQDTGIDGTAFDAFSQTSSGTSLDVTIGPGEAFIFGSWVAKDTTTTVTLASSTPSQTVYVGWNKSGTDDVIVGLESAFSGAAGDTDEKIPLYDFDTDGSGVTSVTDRRTIGKTLDGRFIQNTTSVSSNVTTDGEQLVFADSSGGPLTVTLSTTDLDAGSNVIVVDSGGAAKSNNITIDTEGAATINGSTSVTIESEYGAKAIASDGSNWYTSGAGGAGGVTVEDSGTISVDPAGAVNFGTDLSVTDDGDGTVTVDSTVDPTIAVEDDGTGVSSSVDTIDFGGSDFGVTNPTTGEAQVALTNDSLTVNSGDGLKNGGSVSLGGSTTLDVEPADFAGSGLQDDGTDDLELVNNSVTVTAGTGLTGGGTVSLGGSITVDVDPADDEKITFGTGDDFTLRYDSTNDDIRLEDNGTSDRLALDRTTGDLSIEGTLTEGATL